MKSYVVLFCLTAAVCTLSCENDTIESPEEFEYHAHIHSPDNTDKTLGDTLHIEVEIESHTGMEIHHINIRIYNKATGTEVYSEPDDPHVE